MKLNSGNQCLVLLDTKNFLFQAVFSKEENIILKLRFVIGQKLV